MAGFSEINGVVYANFHKSIIRITVLYELIKGITVLYVPNQVHNCTVWLSYAVDYYFMSYTAHFFALILPRKVQYIHVKGTTKLSASLNIFEQEDSSITNQLKLQVLIYQPGLKIQVLTVL